MQLLMIVLVDTHLQCVGLHLPVHVCFRTSVHVSVFVLHLFVYDDWLQEVLE